MSISDPEEVRDAPHESIPAAEKRRQTLLGTSDNILARCVAPAMPWLFLSLRRALIPTVCLLVLAVLFCAVPQTGEVLLGLTEPVSQHVTGPRSGSSLNVAPLTWYLVWSVLLSLAVWYSARLLCTVEAWLGMPLVWEIRNLGPYWPSDDKDEDDPKRANEKLVRIAIERLPRAYGVGALVAAIGALVFATLFSMPRAAALALVACLLAGPLVFTCGALEWREAEWRWRSVPAFAMAAGGVVYIASALVLAFSFRPEAQQSVGAVLTLDILCALLPALLLAFLVLRRPVMKRIYMTWFKRSEKRFTYDAFESHHALKFEDVFWQVLMFVLVGAVLLALLAILQTKYVRSIGSVGTIMLFLAAALVSITGCQLFLRRISHAVPGFTSAVAIVVFVVLQFFSHEPLGNEALDCRFYTGSPAEKLPAGPVRGAAAEGAGPKPRVLVNAYGGGLRAAIYTAQILALADDASCGEFGRHLEALSGVSGGSLGIAVYLVARQTLAPRDVWKNCARPSMASKSAAQFPTPLTDVVTNALVQDHLSPVIATAVSIDVFLRTPLTPHAYAKRGQAMLDSWNDALDEAFEPYGVSKAAPAKDCPLALPIERLNGGITPAPLVFFNTTDADSGASQWFSNGAGSKPLSSFKPPDPQVHMTVGQAVLHSARFPLVTPAGNFQEHNRRYRLVDGGYADNSGARTLSAALPVSASGADASAAPDDLVLLDINGNPPDSIAGEGASADGKNTPPPESSIPTALLALLQARAARADDAVQDLANALPSCRHRADSSQACVIPIQLDSDVDKSGRHPGGRNRDQSENVHTAPLGWYTGPGASQRLAVSSKARVQDVCKRAGTQCNPVQ